MTASKSQWLPYLIFTMGAQRYALPIESVVEVAAMVELVETPGVSREFLGVANRHGSVLPMLDLRPIFKLPASKIDMSTLFVVAQVSQQMVGLVVDSIEQIEYVTADQLSLNQGHETYIDQIITHENLLIQVVALPTLLAAYLPQDLADYVESV